LFETMAGRVVNWVLRHNATLPEQSIGSMADATQMRQLLHGPAPEQPSAFDAVLERFSSTVAPFAFRPAHPRFFAFVPSAPSPVSILGDWLSAGCNFFAGVWLEAAGPTQVELTVLDWFRTLLGMPEGAGGLLTSGGSDANLTAIVAAREPLSRDERHRAVMYVSDQRHWSLDRAAKIAGFYPEQVRAVASDGAQRMDVSALARHIAEDRAAGRFPWLVAANAGTTNTGAIDPLPQLVELCRRERLWLHVDAAYGWANVLDPQGAKELASIGAADSVTLDPHKWFAQGFEAGALLLRDPAALERAFKVGPEYMQDVEAGEDEVNFCDRGIALTRRFRAMKIWFSVQVLGLNWFRQLVTYTRWLARHAAGLVADAGFEITSPPRLSVVGFRWAPSGLALDAVNRLNLAIAGAVRETGEMFLSTTTLDGAVVLRFCFVNGRTTVDDVARAVALLRREAVRLTGAKGERGA
jgi:glutamate/tyrosine decarboxylase-like PLP-dependent enzyme